MLDPPLHKVNWGVKIGHGDIDLDKMASRVCQLHEEEGLEAADLVVGFILRRVQPFQRRPHRMCDMTNHRDPTRTSTFKLTEDQVRERVRALTDVEVSDTWWFGKKPYSRRRPPPQVS